MQVKEGKYLIQTNRNEVRTLAIAMMKHLKDSAEWVVEEKDSFEEFLAQIKRMTNTSKIYKTTVALYGLVGNIYNSGEEYVNNELDDFYNRVKWGHRG